MHIRWTHKYIYVYAFYGKTAKQAACPEKAYYFPGKRKSFMKIMLAAVNSKYIHSNPAVYSLYAYARAYEEFLLLKEYTINQSKDQILKGIYSEKPDILCFSCYIWNISLIRELAAELYKLLPGIHIWMGGPEVSYDAGAVLKECSFLKGVMRGEGEATFLELVQYYIGQPASLSQIKGITWYDGEGQVWENPDRAVLELSTVPFPYRNLVEFEHRIIYYESSRGCPFSCSYCLSSIDRSLRFRSLERVKEEIQFFLDHKVQQVKFVDRTFNCCHDHAMGIWSYIKEHDNGITNFHFEIASDLLRDEEIALLNSLRPGLVQLEIGVQSLNRDTLTEIRRTMDFEKVSRNVAAISKGRNVHQHLDLIAGLPYEDYKSFGKSFDIIYQLRPQQLQLGFLKVLKGSYMAAHAVEYECVYQAKEPYEVLQTKWLSYEDILKLKGIEDMVEVYYNSGQFEKTMQAAVLFFSSPFSFYEALAEFYEEKGYFGISHTRMHRYDILQEFLAGIEGVCMPYMQELMLFDLYAREKLKKRPDWALDQGKFKQRMRAFYQKEKESCRYLPGYEEYDERQMSKMTHLELFYYDLNKIEITPVTKDIPDMILFDYKRRDILTKSAVSCKVEDEV